MTLQSGLQPALDRVRAAGAEVLRGLPDAHHGGIKPPQLDAFDAGVHRLAAAVAGTQGACTEQAASHARALVSEFLILSADLRTYVEDAKAAADMASLPVSRGGRRASG